MVVQKAAIYENPHINKMHVDIIEPEFEERGDRQRNLQSDNDRSQNKRFEICEKDEVVHW